MINNNELSKIKSKIFGSLNNLSLEELIKKSKYQILKLKIIVDFKYNVKINNNKEELERNEKIIVFGLKDKLKIFQNKDYRIFYRYYA